MPEFTTIRILHRANSYCRPKSQNLKSLRVMTTMIETFHKISLEISRHNEGKHYKLRFQFIAEL